MKTLLSLIKKYEDVILVVLVAAGILAFLTSLLLLFFGDFTNEESDIIFSFGIIALAVGCGSPIFILGINDYSQLKD